MRVAPKTVTPEADWPEFGELDGAPVRLTEVEATVPVGRRPDVVVRFPADHRRAPGVALRPWRGAPFLVYGDDGKPLGPA